MVTIFFSFTEEDHLFLVLCAFVRLAWDVQDQFSPQLNAVPWTISTSIEILSGY